VTNRDVQVQVDPVTREVTPKPGAEIVPNDEALPLSPLGLVATDRPLLQTVAAPRRRRRRGKLYSFLVFVVLPTLGAATYYLAIAANQYVSEFRCVIHTADGAKEAETSATHATAGQSQLVLYSNVAVEYVKGEELVSQLQRTVDLRSIFASSRADWLARLNPRASKEELTSYWGNMVDPYFDLATGTISVTVRAFTPADALRISNAIIASTEKLVDGISLQARRDAVRVDEEEVASAARKLRDIHSEILDYRNRVQLLEPKQEADNRLGLLGKLQQDLSDTNTTLVTQRQTMSPNAPTVQALNHRIVALKQQIAALQSQLTTPSGSTTKAMSQSLGGFEALDAQRQIQEQYYASTLETLSHSRETADRKMAYLSVFEQPNLPETATYPNRMKSIGLTFMAALGGWIMMTLLYRSVRDHM
jgi:capsular polysaccharide transport system permease protein